MSTRERPENPGCITPKTTEQHREDRETPIPAPPGITRKAYCADLENGFVRVKERSDNPYAWLEIDDENVFQLEAMA